MFLDSFCSFRWQNNRDALVAYDRRLYKNVLKSRNKISSNCKGSGSATWWLFQKPLAELVALKSPRQLHASLHDIYVYTNIYIYIYMYMRSFVCAGPWLWFKALDSCWLLAACQQWSDFEVQLPQLDVVRRGVL